MVRSQLQGLLIMAKDALELITLRNHFYRDNFRRIVWLLLCSIVLNIFLAIVLTLIYHNQPQPIYFASTSDGRLIKMQGLDHPVMSNTAINSWLSRAIPQIYNLDFVHYRGQIQNMNKYFTPQGWAQFSHAFLPTMKKIKDDKLLASATLSNVPIVVRSGLLGGVYSWLLQVPVLVSFQKGDQTAVQHVIWNVTVQRVDNTKSDQLVGISQVIAKTQEDNHGN